METAKLYNPKEIEELKNLKVKKADSVAELCLKADKKFWEERKVIKVEENK